ncbi:MAG: hypothetical protein QOJ89_3714 [bacterium]
MTEQTTPDTDEPEAAADDAIDVAEVADVDADAAEADADQPDADASGDDDADASGDDDADASADFDADAGGGDDDDDDEPARDPEAQAAVDEVTDHATRLAEPGEGQTASDFRTPPGIPDGLDPGEPDDRG